MHLHENKKNYDGSVNLPQKYITIMKFRFSGSGESTAFESIKCSINRVSWDATQRKHDKLADILTSKKKETSRYPIASDSYR